MIIDLTEPHDLPKSLNQQHTADRHVRLEGMGQLLAALAHQLRTPLAAAMLQTSNLELLLGHSAAPEIKRILEELHMVLEQMENKINDVLLFARGGRVLHDILTPQRLLDELQTRLSRESLQPMHINCEGQFSTPAKTLICNRNSLVSSVHNLINNAREAGADNIDILLSQTDDKLYLQIKDNGPGLSSSELENILKPFYTTKSTGTGLGLPVVRLITEAYGGKMTISSQPGKGLCVTIILPLTDPITATAKVNATHVEAE